MLKQSRISATFTLLPILSLSFKPHQLTIILPDLIRQPPKPLFHHLTSTCCSYFGSPPTALYPFHPNTSLIESLIPTPVYREKEKSYSEEGEEGIQLSGTLPAAVSLHLSQFPALSNLHRPQLSLLCLFNLSQFSGMWCYG
jgi:hypothetical protein